MTLLLEHHFRDGLDPFATWTGEDVDRTLVETGPDGLKLHVAEVAGGWKGAEVVWPVPITYGRIVIRCRLPVGRFKGLALLWPADKAWPPEIDFYEIGAMWSDRHRWNQTVHYVDDDGRYQMLQTHVDRAPGYFADWHRISVAWRPGVIRYGLGGDVVKTVRSPHVPDEPMKLHLKSSPGRLAEHDPGAFEVEWVRVFA